MSKFGKTPEKGNAEGKERHRQLENNEKSKAQAQNKQNLWLRVEVVGVFGMV